MSQSAQRLHFKYKLGKVRLVPIQPVVSPLTVHVRDLWGSPQGICRVLTLHHTTCAVQLANPSGSFALCASKLLLILAPSPPSHLVCWFLGKYWSSTLKTCV